MDESNTPTPTAPMSTSPTSPASGPTAELSPAQAETMISWIKEDLLAGKMTQEAATKAFNQLGATAEQLAPDTRSDEVKSLDQQYPPGKPTDYTIRYGEPGQPAPPMTEELQQFDMTARAWLSGAEFDRTLGNSLVSTIAKVAQQTKDMNEEQLEGYGMSEFKKLERVFGPALEAKLQLAAEMIHDLDLKQVGLKQFLRSHGIGDNSVVASLLIQQAERYWARRR